MSLNRLLNSLDWQEQANGYWVAETKHYKVVAFEKVETLQFDSGKPYTHDAILYEWHDGEECWVQVSKRLFGEHGMDAAKLAAGGGIMKHSYAFIAVLVVLGGLAAGILLFWLLALQPTVSAQQQQSNNTSVCILADGRPAYLHGEPDGWLFFVNTSGQLIYMRFDGGHFTVVGQAACKGSSQ